MRLSFDIAEFLTVNLESVKEGRRGDELPRLLDPLAKELLGGSSRDSLGSVLLAREGGWAYLAGAIGEAMTLSAVRFAGFTRVESRYGQVVDFDAFARSGKSTSLESKCAASPWAGESFSCNISSGQIAPVAQGGARYFSLWQLQWAGTSVANVPGLLADGRRVRQVYRASSSEGAFKLSFAWDDAVAATLNPLGRPLDFDQVVRDLRAVAGK